MSEAIQLWLIRHGETEWSASGAHTSYSDIPLTPRGEESAAAIGSWLAGKEFSLISVSPRLRALETCRIAGYGSTSLVDGDLSEWNYGEFEGLTTAKIREEKPGWSIWTEGPVGGESIEQVGARAMRVIERAEAVGGCVGLFSHAHFLRVLAASWVCLPPSAGRSLALSTGSVSILGFERETRVIQMWNRSFERSDP